MLLYVVGPTLFCCRRFSVYSKLTSLVHIFTVPVSKATTIYQVYHFYQKSYLFTLKELPLNVVGIFWETNLKLGTN